ncbi:MAG: transposase family protein [Zoogloea sp.]|nr:transposase family protein [Zoogloea sp.]
MELLTVMVCVELSGADDVVAVHLWAKAKLDWLRGFVKHGGGIPSHDTLGRVFGMIAPKSLKPPSDAGWAW